VKDIYTDGAVSVRYSTDACMHTNPTTHMCSNILLKKYFNEITSSVDEI